MLYVTNNCYVSAQKIQLASSASSIALSILVAFLWFHFFPLHRLKKRYTRRETTVLNFFRLAVFETSKQSVSGTKNAKCDIVDLPNTACRGKSAGA